MQAHFSPAHEESFSLSKYLSHIELSGDLTPSLQTLKLIILHHNKTFIYRNKLIYDAGRLPVFARNVPPLDKHRLFSLMVSNHGGYCFQQLELLHAVLSELQFTLTRHVAKIILQPSEKIISEDGPIKTHEFLMVHLDGKQYMIDSGMSHASLREPLEFKEGVATLSTDEYHLRKDDQQCWSLDTRMQGKPQWYCLYQFFTAPVDASMIAHYQNELYLTPDFRTIRDELNVCGMVTPDKRRSVTWFNEKGLVPGHGLYYCAKAGREKKKEFSTLAETEMFAKKKFGIP